MLTREQFAKQNKLFRSSCQLAGIAPSRHQAGRWRKNQGLAWAAYVRAQQQAAGKNG